MRNVNVVLLTASLLACQREAHRDDEVGPALDAAVDAEVLDGDILQMISRLPAYPGALRAFHGLRCRTEASCRRSQGRAVIGDHCDAESAVWSMDFAQAFDACVIERKTPIWCFDEALSAHVPSEAQLEHAEQCRAALANCSALPLEACRALEALEDPELVQAILDCRKQQDCFGRGLCFPISVQTNAAPMPASCQLTEDAGPADAEASMTGG